MDNRYQERKTEKTEKSYAVAIVIFLIGIAALAGAIALGYNNLNPGLLLCEIIGLICLIGLLVVCTVARRRTILQKQQKQRNPYSGVDSHEIDRILDLINERENKRRMAEAFAKGEEAVAVKENDEEEDTTADEDELTYLVIDDEAEAEKQEEKKASEEKVETKPDASDKQEQGDKTDTERKEGDGMSYEDDRPRRRPEGERRERDPYYDGYYDERSRQRPPRDRERGYRSEYDDPRRRRPTGYDPYYDDYYDDRSRQRGSRDGRERDQYGRTYYNEYGEPVRRRPPSPYDDRRPRRRRPDGRPEQRRPRYEDEERRPTGPIRQENELDEEAKATAAVEAVSAPAKEEMEYDSEFIPIVVPYDDYDPDEMADYHARHRSPSATRKSGSGSADRGRNDRAPADDDSEYEDERVIVRIPDDDEYEREYSEEELRQDREQRRSTAVSRRSEAPQGEGDSWKRTRHEYVPEYEDEAPIVSLPRDEEYDEYLERKREEEKKAEAEREKEKRKAERRASGKVVLTIANIRRHKIRRKSRKYKYFRASVTHLGDYLNSFSARTGRR